MLTDCGLAIVIKYRYPETTYPQRSRGPVADGGSLRRLLTCWFMAGRRK